ncbi:hypothetical protein NCCP2145_27240 [Pseudarthrobacter sp. NCCP-2145]|nr:hypothetical protein NCCP2145_27240 [Pseudarthrobacter sp. NCCP-2145]
MVTSTNMFARSIGSALGVAVFGAVANAIYGGTAGGDSNGPAVVAASGAVFVAALAAGVLTVAAVLAMPAVRAATKDAGGEGSGGSGEPVLTDAEDSSR